MHRESGKNASSVLTSRSKTMKPVEEVYGIKYKPKALSAISASATAKAKATALAKEKVKATAMATATVAAAATAAAGASKMSAHSKPPMKSNGISVISLKDPSDFNIETMNSLRPDCNKYLITASDRYGHKVPVQMRRRGGNVRFNRSTARGGSASEVAQSMQEQLFNKAQEKSSHRLIGPNRSPRSKYLNYQNNNHNNAHHNNNNHNSNHATIQEFSSARTSNSHLQRNCNPNGNGGCGGVRTSISFDENDLEKFKHQHNHHHHHKHNHHNHNHNHHNNSCGSSTCINKKTDDPSNNDDKEDDTEEFIELIRHEIEKSVTKSITERMSNTFIEINKKVDRQAGDIKRLALMIQKLQSSLNNSIAHYGEENTRHFRYLCMKAEYDNMLYQQHHNQMTGNSVPTTPQSARVSPNVMTPAGRPTPPPSTMPSGALWANKNARPQPRLHGTTAPVSDYHHSSLDQQHQKHQQQQQQQQHVNPPSSSTSSNNKNKPNEDSFREMVGQLKKFCIQYESGSVLDDDFANKSGTSVTPSCSSGRTTQFPTSFQPCKRVFDEDELNFSSDDGMTPRSNVINNDSGLININRNNQNNQNNNLNNNNNRNNIHIMKSNNIDTLHIPRLSMGAGDE